MYTLLADTSLVVSSSAVGNIKLGDGPAGLPIGGLPVGGLPAGGVPGLPDADQIFGGLPVKNIAGLPAGGLPVDGLPVGGLPGLAGGGDGTVVNGTSPRFIQLRSDSSNMSLTLYFCTAL